MHQRRNGGAAPNSNGSSGHFNTNNTMYNRAAGSGDPERGLSASEMNSNIMEQQNNERISELSEQVAMLKGLTIDIGNEVREQNAYLDQMGDGFSNVGDLLSGSLKKIGTMLQSGGAKHMCYMVGFVVAVMVLLYWLMK